MSVLDIFNHDAFKVTRLIGVMREIKHVPGFISRRGLFQVSSIDTLDFVIDKDKEQNLKLVPASPRGAPGTTFGKKKASTRKIGVPHFQVDDAVYADEVQNVRAVGEERAVQSLQAKIASRAAEASQFFSLTEEFHRLKVLTTGMMYDADGEVLWDYTKEFEENIPTEIDFSFDTNKDGKLRKFCANVHRDMAERLGGLPFSGIEALCGNAFFDDLVENAEFREAHMGHAAALQLLQGYVSGSGQNDTFGVVQFGDITFINYRGSLPIPMKPPHCSEMIAPPDSGMISPPVSSGSAGSNCCQFVRVMCQALRGRFRRRLSPLSSMRWALWTRRSRMASA